MWMIVERLTPAGFGDGARRIVCQSCNSFNPNWKRESIEVRQSSAFVCANAVRNDFQASICKKQKRQSQRHNEGRKWQDRIYDLADKIAEGKII
jgi:hypothetical protein